MAKQIVNIPNIGDFKEVPVLELFVSVGEEVTEESSILSLESAKAVTDIPTGISGTVVALLVGEGDLVSEGMPFVEIETIEALIKDEPATPVKEQKTENLNEEDESPRGKSGLYHATPSLRQYARDKKIPLDRVTGTGPHGRILKEDIDSLVSPKREETSKVSQSMRSEDERVPLSRIQRLSGPHILDSWQKIPHVTQFDEADITDLEDFRRTLKDEYTGAAKIRILPFIIQALISSLRRHPAFNAEFDEIAGELILRRQYHIGIAVDTPDGLVVPVIHDADTKSTSELALELFELSSRAREGRLNATDISGGTFTISSLGGISGTGFTPIINAPQTAILGVSRTKKTPLWDGQTFKPRDVLPFSVAYDHRVIDGAAGARFTRDLSKTLSDIRRILL